MVEKITFVQLEIVGLFRENYQQRLHLRQLAALLGRSHVTLRPHLRILEQRRILRGSIVGRSKVFELARNNNETREYLVLAEKAVTLNAFAKQPLLRKIHDETINFSAAIILFGSHASGKESATSDVDLLVLGRLTQAQRRNLATIGLYGKKIHSTHLPLNALEQTFPPLLEEAVKHHIIICNHDLFLTAVWRRYRDA